MAAGLNDWDEPTEWPKGHPIRDAFATLTARVAEGRLLDGASLPLRLDQSQRRVLLSGMERLLDGCTHPSLGPDIGQILRVMATKKASGGARRGWEPLAPTLGLVAGSFDAERAKNEGRQYRLAQIQAMSPLYWLDPVQGILFSTMHYGLELALRRKRRKPEPLKTEALLSNLHVALWDHIIPAMDKAKVRLPATHTLDVGTASMQDHRDLLAADLAIVAGVRILGRPMYRIILFQAKNATVTGRVDASEGGGGQLDKLLSTGMGWYLFYPTYRGKGTFIPTARPAIDVYREVWQGDAPPSFKLPTAYGDEASPAWDFASFVSIAMSSDTDLTLGRLFPDIESAATALTDDGKKPLAADIIAFDRTGSLRLNDFIDATAAIGYKERRALSFPTARDIIARPDDEDDVPEDPFAPR